MSGFVLGSTARDRVRASRAVPTAGTGRNSGWPSPCKGPHVWCKSATQSTGASGIFSTGTPNDGGAGLGHSPPGGQPCRTLTRRVIERDRGQADRDDLVVMAAAGMIDTEQASHRRPRARRACFIRAASP